MAYSNSYDQSAVIAALKDRVGFRQPASGPTLSSAVTTTISGRCFQDFHTLVTIDNIKATMELKPANDAQLITYLEQLRNAAITRALGGVFTRQDIEQVKLFSREGKFDRVVANTGLFVGYEVEVADRADVAVQIDALHLYLDSAKTFNVYVFKDGKETPIQTISVTTVANEITEKIPTEIVLNRGKYFIGYFQNDITPAQAYNEMVDDWACTKAFSAECMISQSTGDTTFNREQISYSTVPYGLNIEISSFTDHTAQAKRKAGIFDELIGLTFSYMVLEQIVYAVRSNATERFLKDQLSQLGIKFDMDGAAPITGSPQVMGLKQRIDRETETVKEAFYPKQKAMVVSQC